MIKPSLSEKKIIVTGGSRGIGSAIVKVLAEEGARVAFSYSTRKDAAEALLKSLPGEGHFIFHLDLSSEESIESAFSRILKTWPEVDGLVNNAGITKDALLLRMKTDEFESVVDTNLRGAFLTTKFLCKPFMKARRGSIVNIASIIGLTGNAGQANYAASKGGLIAFSKSVAQELASRNIRVNCVAPGFIETVMTSQLSDEIKQTLKGKIPLNCFGSATDVANGVRFLLSDEAKYITGQTLSINGGLYMG
jgi:3-oxoacyl-[acyl-carrier protein] reductase